MEPIFGFLLFAVVVTLVAVVAKKRGRSIWGVVLAMLVGAPLLAFLVAQASRSGMAAGIAAFLVPVGVVLWLMSADKSEDLAVKEGEHGDYKKCPFCAEPVRKEALKCKHCGSPLDVEKAVGGS